MQAYCFWNKFWEMIYKEGESLIAYTNFFFFSYKMHLLEKCFLMGSA